MKNEALRRKRSQHASVLVQDLVARYVTAQVSRTHRWYLQRIGDPQSKELS